MTITVIAVVALALLCLGGAAFMFRRSLIGLLVGIELGAGALLLLAGALFDFTGPESSTGQVIVAGLVAFAVAAAVLVTALHLAAVRAGRRTSDLEPW